MLHSYSPPPARGPSLGVRVKWAVSPGSRVRQGSSWQWVLEPKTYLVPVLLRLSVGGSARAAPPGRSLGGGAHPAGRPAPPGLVHAPAPAAAAAPRPLPARCGRQPGPASGARANGRPGPQTPPRPGPAPSPPRPGPAPLRPPETHRSRIQRAGAHRCAPAAGPTRPVCLGRANGAIVPPPALWLNGALSPEDLRMPRLGGGGEGNQGSGTKVAAGLLLNFGWGVLGPSGSNGSYGFLL